MEIIINIILQKFNSKMSCKQVLSKRPAYTNAGFKLEKSYKQNNIGGSYQLDPKIEELKRKYQLDKPQPNVGYVGHRPASNLRQQQVLKKLQNIKCELQAIPDWQNFAKSILFDQSTRCRDKFNVFEARQTPKYMAHYGVQSKRISEESCEDSKILDNSDISFKINHAKSIEKLDEKSKPSYNDIAPYTPVRTASQFKIGKYRDQTIQQVSGFNDKNDKVDEKISEISRKIKQSQLKKKSLGVDFVPFQKKVNHRKYESPTYQIQYNFKSKTPQYLSKKPAPSIEKSYTRASKPAQVTSKFTDVFKQNKLFTAQLEAHSPRFAPAPIAGQNFQYSKILSHNETATKGIDQFNEKSASKKNRSYSVYQKPEPNFNLNFEKSYQMENEQSRAMLQKAEQAIKERKKKIDIVEKKRSKQNTHKLVQAFCQQVKLDQKFRNCKLWFKSNRNEKKLERLKSILELEGLRLDQFKINEEFNVEEKQDNPFFSVSSQSCDIQQVARSYLQSEKYWKKNLYRRFNKNALEHEDFNSLSIDLDKKGYIVLEDLVRFLNMETGTFFRNRDLFTIFKRMSNNSEKLNFNTFVQTFYA